MEIRVPVSVGELLDKVSILRIKSQRIRQPEKLSNINNELNALLAVCKEHGVDPAQPLAAELEKINNQLWDVEDALRELERTKDFGTRFVELARSVYICNDKRFAIKAQINQSSGSRYREEKSYKPY